MEKQKHLVGDIVWVISYTKEVKDPFISKCLVTKSEIRKNQIGYQVALVKGEKEDVEVYRWGGWPNKDLYSNPKTPMKIIEKMLEKENRKRKRDFRKKLKELEIK